MTRFSRGSLLLATSLVLCPAPLAALPITTGTWAATALPTLETAKSEDCATCAALWLLPPGTEQLSGGFGYADWPGAERISHQTDYQDGALTWDGASFAYANGHGFASSSWDGAHQQLFRLVAPELTTYWLAIEDLPAPAVWDWNDAVYRWQEPIKSAPAAVCAGAKRVGAAGDFLGLWLAAEAEDATWGVIFTRSSNIAITATWMCSLSFHGCRAITPFSQRWPACGAVEMVSCRWQRHVASLPMPTQTHATRLTTWRTTPCPGSQLTSLRRRCSEPMRNTLSIWLSLRASAHLAHRPASCLASTTKGSACAAGERTEE